MESSAGPGMPSPKYCSMARILKAPAWACAAPPWDFSFICPLALQAPWLTWHNPPTRYVSYHPFLHIGDLACQGPGWLGTTGDAADTWVLARREPDGFYYRAQIKPAPELEREGALLVEFETPLVTDPKLPAQWQSVVLEEDVIQFPSSKESSLRPGDKVLALWGPGRQRYGPGTVLSGLEARDPQRESKEITVHFWNGRTATVPPGGVRWVPPTVWKKAVEKLHKPFAREHPTPLLWAPRCCLLGPPTGLPLGTPFLCPPCHSLACCQPLCWDCLCGSPLAGPTWWPLTRTSGLLTREHPEVERKPTAQLMPLEGPEEEEAPVQTPMAVSSSSSASSSASLEEDLENDPEMSLSQRLMADSTANTDPVLLEKSPRRQGGLCQPEWRYWRRNGYEPCPGKPGTRCFNIQKEEKGNQQQRAQMVLVGNTEELVVAAIAAKALQILPGEAKRRKPCLRTAAHQRGQDSPETRSPVDPGS